MQRYHFTIHDGIEVPDHDGCLLPDRETARRLAVEYAGAVLQSEAGRIMKGDRWRMDVTDAQGEMVMCLDLRLSTAALPDRFEVCGFRPDARM